MTVRLPEQTAKHVEGILAHVRKYLLIRFHHANRIEPRMRQIEGDLIWHELEVVRQVISRSKPYAEFRFIVADIFASFDHTKRWGLFSTSDMNCLISSIVTVIDEVDTKKTGVLHIRDMRGLYKVFDPRLDSIVELIQIWIWWDLIDASDMHLFDVQLERLATLSRASINERLQVYYRVEMKLERVLPPTMEEIRTFELERTEKLLGEFEARLAQEEIYQQIIGYEMAEDRVVDHKFIDLAEHLREFEKLAANAELDKETRSHYSRMLRIGEGSVTHEKAVAYERKFIDEAKRHLLEVLESEESAGTRYNFKERQLEECKERMIPIRNLVLASIEAEREPEAEAQSG